MLVCKHIHLILCESVAGCQIGRVNHGIFVEIVQCRLRIVPLDGEYAREVCPSKDVVGTRPLEKTAQQVNVGRCNLFVRSPLAQDGVPLIDDHHEALART